MIFVSDAMVLVSESAVWETKTMVAKTETIFSLTGKMVSVIKKVFSFEKTMVSGIKTIFCVMQTIFMTTETIVAAAKKTVSAAPTMVCKVLSIVFLMVERSFANPKLVCFWSFQPARIVSNSKNSQSASTDQHNSNVFALQTACQFVFYLSAASGRPASRSNAGSRCCLSHFLERVSRELRPETNSKSLALNGLREAKSNILTI